MRGCPTLGRTNLRGEIEPVLTKGLVEPPCTAEFICLTPSSTRQRTSSEEEEMSRIQPVISDDICPLPLSGLSCLCPAIEGVGLSH